MKQVQQQATYQEESKELDDLWSSIPSEFRIVQSTNLRTIKDILSIIKTIRYPQKKSLLSKRSLGLSRVEKLR